MGSTAAASVVVGQACPGVESLDAEAWHQALRQLVGASSYDEALAGDAVRRCHAGVLGVRDLRLLLLVTGDARGWVPARRAAVEVLARNPEKARQVLLTHTQVEVLPPPRFTEETQGAGGAGGVVSFTAAIGPAGHEVTGPPQRAHTTRDAQDRAALALVACLAGVVLPGDMSAREQEVDRLVLPGMVSEVFEQCLRLALDAGAGPGADLEEEALRRARSGRLRPRDLYLLLLCAHGSAWDPVRSEALERAAAMPPTAATLLHWYAEAHGEAKGLAYDHDPASTPERPLVRARLQAGQLWTGPARSAHSRKTAQHVAACALLAQLAGLPEPAVRIEDKPAGPAVAPRIAVPGQGQDPVKYLNTLQQKGAISKPESRVRQLGPLVECAYSCRHMKSGAQVSTSASGPSKAAARGAAALRLLRKLQTLDTSQPQPRAAPSAALPHSAEQLRLAADVSGPGAVDFIPASPAPALPQEAGRPLLVAGDGAADVLLEEALAAGCSVVFVPARAGALAGWWVEDSGVQCLPMTGLPVPLTPGHSPAGAAGWRVPLLLGVQVLRRAGTGASAASVFWQRAVHLALQLVRARLIYPALEDERRATWRVGPLPAAAREALATLAAAAPSDAVPAGMPAPAALAACCDALADMLVRTPAAALFGSSPWTSPDPEPMALETLGAMREWLDRVEDQADGGTAPVLVLRVDPPSDAQAATGRLSAGLHLACVGTEQEVPATHVWSGTAALGGEDAAAVRPRVQRALRRAGRWCPALAMLAAQDSPQHVMLDAAAIEALLEREEYLAGAGLRVVWPGTLRTALQTAAVIGADPGPRAGGGRAGERPRFSISALLDFHWQVALEGEELSEAEMNALADAARPLVRVRGQWVLADPVLRRRARHRLLGQLPGTQALTAALAGTLTVDDAVVACRPAGSLAAVLGVLSRGENHPDAVPVPAGLQAVLRGYQERALTWLARTTALGFGAVLADDMGLGKTLTALAFTLHHQQHASGPTLVVCPASLVSNWRREAHRFAPGLPVVEYHGPGRTLEPVTDTTLVITTYGVLRRDRARLADRDWSLVIADEAQYAKNSASATARQLRALPSVTRLALTGTPVENNLSELWALLDWVNPALLGTVRSFRTRWANAAERDPACPEAAELNRLIAPFVLRRRKSDPGIAPELPAKVHQRRIVRLSTDQTALYEAVVRESLEQVQASTGIARKGLVFKLITALKQITNHPAHFLREKPPRALTDEDAARFTARSSKAAALVELLDTIRQRDEAALIFTSFVEMGHLLHAHLAHLGHDPLFLRGGTPLAERQRMVDRFQAGDHPVMILSLKAAGTGLNLTRASHVIHYDRSWNAAVEDQATDRAHRIGQHRTVTVHHLITEHTVEDRIAELLTHKRALQDGILAGGEDALGQLTDRELADLVRLGGH